MGDRSYAILGTGALGGFYGARLARAGLDVHFLLHGDYEHVRDRGLLVESAEGDIALPHVNAYGRAEDMPRCDVVCVCLKTTANHLLAELLPPVLAEGGVVLVLQNGLGIEEHVAGIVGPDRVMGGLCFLCSNKVGPGHICHLDYGYITLADFDGAGGARGITGRMRAIGGDFERAGVRIRFAEDLVGARWRKLIWNVPFNGLTVVLRTTTDHLMADEHTRGLAERLMRDVAAAAKAATGRVIDDGFLRSQLADTAKMAPYRPSMLLDHEAGRPMEIEAIFGAPLRAARAAGCPVPHIEALYAMLKFLDAR
ncbi:MAG TPA: putative 2-dehydropantoate 2-reductase [Phycisphaerae bacterium]|nr:putative 2-dehydropantoate 2-reductase [Phycisphaerae bacterium]